MNTTFDHTIEKLTRPWSDTHTVEGEYVTVQYEPLLDMLKDSRASSTGFATGGSGGGGGSVINDRAFTLWELIDGDVSAWLREFGVTPPKNDLKAGVVTLHRTVLDLWAGARIQETLYLRIMAKTQRWVEQIWDLWHHVEPFPVEGDCPACGAGWVLNADGDQQRALVATVVGGVPSATCRAGCGWEVSGLKASLELARRIGASPDVDTIHELNNEPADREDD